MNIIHAGPNFLKEVKIELGKVTWPSRPQLIRLTALVIAVSAVVGIYLGLLDFFLARGLSSVVGK